MHEELEDLRLRLVHYVRRKFSNLRDIHHVAEDIVNQAFCQCIGAKSYTPDKLNFGYLATTCVHIAYETHEGEQREYPEADAQSDGIGETTEEQVLKQIDSVSFLQHFETLREVDAQTLYLRYFAQYTFAEIALHLDRKLSTILSIHRRALQKLKPRLSEHFTEGEAQYAYPAKRSNCVKFL